MVVGNGRAGIGRVVIIGGIGRVVIIGLVVGILIGVAIGAAELTGGGGTNSSTNTGTPTTTTSSSSSSQSTATSSSTSSSPSTTATTSSTSQSQGGPLLISIARAISDSPEASAGSKAFIYDVSITNMGSGSYDVNPLYFTMITASNSVYDSTFFLAIRQSLSAVTLNQGQTTSGQIGFQIPNGQTPSKLEFNNQFESVDEFVTGIPQPTVWVSEPNCCSGQITLTGTDSGQLLATYSFSNNTEFFYTGDIITLKVGLNDFYSFGSVTLNTLTLASSDTGFILSSISPSLPITVTAGGSEVDVYVYIVAPSSSFTGAIDLNGTTN
jgi:hypothetical protein